MMGNGGGMGGFPGMGGMGGMGGMPGFGGMGGGMPPMDPAMLAQMEAMMGGGAAQANPADTRPPREKYATELAQIKEMGFHDEEVILQMLVSTNGNVSLALERLFTSLN